MKNNGVVKESPAASPASLAAQRLPVRALITGMLGEQFRSPLLLAPSARTVIDLALIKTVAPLLSPEVPSLCKCSLRDVSFPLPAKIA